MYCAIETLAQNSLVTFLLLNSNDGVHVHCVTAAMKHDNNCHYFNFTLHNTNDCVGEDKLPHSSKLCSSGPVHP